jgi:hypothetical protein
MVDWRDAAGTARDARDADRELRRAVDRGKPLQAQAAGQAGDRFVASATSRAATCTRASSFRSWLALRRWIAAVGVVVMPKTRSPFGPKARERLPQPEHRSATPWPGQRARIDERPCPRRPGGFGRLGRRAPLAGRRPAKPADRRREQALLAKTAEKTENIPPAPALGCDLENHADCC